MESVKAVAPQRWWYLMPIIFITYSLAYLDRANYGFAAAAGIDRDLGITHGTSSLIGSLFFLGYCLFQVPGAIYAQRNSVKKLIFFSLILWGLCAAATGMVSNIPMLMVLRFVLGVVEAAVMPSMLMYISRWFTRSERSRANTFLILGNPVTVLWMSVVSGYLVRSFGWREMFVIEGVPALIWAVVWWFTVKDRPADAIGLINACGALGAFAGSWVVGYLNVATGSPAASFIFMAGGLLSSVILMMTVPANSDEHAKREAALPLQRTQH
ncbi:MFS transporter [Paraburkholderia sp. BL17N1]|uniref:MFS transporter n=1 Tax=Paraburkholderia sp. BL17N1 TaxID=1938798 RepID=UPI000EB28A32|nr:MFS transporter [Paraburkholderia sp. BL17N1]RKR45823.1 MFS transporter [Paraburkholderia sp. BL17N1]